MNRKNKKLIKLFEECAEKYRSADKKGVEDAHLGWAIADTFADLLRQGYQLSDLDSFKYFKQYTGDYWRNNIDELNSEKHQENLQRMGIDGEKFRENVLKQIQKKNKEKAEKENKTFCP